MNVNTRSYPITSYISNHHRALESYETSNTNLYPLETTSAVHDVRGKSLTKTSFYIASSPFFREDMQLTDTICICIVHARWC
jgi:hypothetical protein